MGKRVLVCLQQKKKKKKKITTDALILFSNDLI